MFCLVFAVCNKLCPVPAAPQKLKATALKALLAAIQSLDTWAGPIKSAAAAVALAPDASTALQAGAGAGAGVGDGDGTPGTSPQPRDKEVHVCVCAWGPSVANAGAAGLLFKRTAWLSARLTALPAPHLCCPLYRPLYCMQELQRILADKELKDALLSGIQLFNQNPVKGEWVEGLQAGWVGAWQPCQHGAV